MSLFKTALVKNFIKTAIKKFTIDFPKLPVMTTETLLRNMQPVSKLAAQGINNPMSMKRICG